MEHKRQPRRQGQSIVEYLLIAAVVIGAIAVVANTIIKPKTTELLTGAVNQIPAFPVPRSP